MRNFEKTENLNLRKPTATQHCTQATNSEKSWSSDWPLPTRYLLAKIMETLMTRYVMTTLTTRAICVIATSFCDVKSSVVCSGFVSFTALCTLCRCNLFPADVFSSTVVQVTRKTFFQL